MLTKKEKKMMEAIEYENQVIQKDIENCLTLTDKTVIEQKKINFLGIGRFLKRAEYNVNKTTLSELARVIKARLEERATLKVEYDKLCLKMKASKKRK